MAQIPKVFNASEYFGNPSQQKGQQDSFFDSPSASFNQRASAYQNNFEGTSLGVGTTFMSDSQDFFQNWDSWPSSEKEENNSQFGYQSAELYAPEDLSGGNSSSSESSPQADPDMDWCEDEPLGYAAVSDAAVSPYYSQHFNGEFFQDQSQFGQYTPQLESQADRYDQRYEAGRAQGVSHMQMSNHTGGPPASFYQGGDIHVNRDVGSEAMQNSPYNSYYQGEANATSQAASVYPQGDPYLPYNQEGVNQVPHQNELHRNSTNVQGGGPYPQVFQPTGASAGYNYQEQQSESYQGNQSLVLHKNELHMNSMNSQAGEPYPETFKPSGASAGYGYQEQGSESLQGEQSLVDKENINYQDMLHAPQQADMFVPSDGVSASFQADQGLYSSPKTAPIFDTNVQEEGLPFRQSQMFPPTNSDYPYYREGANTIPQGELHVNDSSVQASATHSQVLQSFGESAGYDNQPECSSNSLVEKDSNSSPVQAAQYADMFTSAAAFHAEQGPHPSSSAPFFVDTKIQKEEVLSTPPQTFPSVEPYHLYPHEGANAIPQEGLHQDNKGEKEEVETIQGAHHHQPFQPFEESADYAHREGSPMLQAEQSQVEKTNPKDPEAVPPAQTAELFVPFGGTSEGFHTEQVPLPSSKSPTVIDAQSKEEETVLPPRQVFPLSVPHPYYQEGANTAPQEETHTYDMGSKEGNMFSVQHDPKVFQPLAELDGYNHQEEVDGSLQRNQSPAGNDKIMDPASFPALTAQQGEAFVSFGGVSSSSYGDQGPPPSSLATTFGNTRSEEDNRIHVPPNDNMSQVSGVPPANLEEKKIPMSATPVLTNLPAEPESPQDAVQVAFHRKKLAGQEPAASPRTSLWMDGTSLAAPCVLAPAVVVAPEQSEPQYNEQAPPVDNQKPRNVEDNAVAQPLTVPQQTSTFSPVAEENVERRESPGRQPQPKSEPVMSLASILQGGIAHKNVKKPPNTKEELPQAASTPEGTAPPLKTLTEVTDRMPQQPGSNVEMTPSEKSLNPSKTNFERQHPHEHRMDENSYIHEDPRQRASFPVEHREKRLERSDTGDEQYSRDYPKEKGKAGNRLNYHGNPKEKGDKNPGVKYGVVEETRSDSEDDSNPQYSNNQPRERENSRDGLYSREQQRNRGDSRYGRNRDDRDRDDYDQEFLHRDRRREREWRHSRDESKERDFDPRYDQDDRGNYRRPYSDDDYYDRKYRDERERDRRDNERRTEDYRDEYSRRGDRDRGRRGYRGRDLDGEDFDKFSDDRELDRRAFDRRDFDSRVRYDRDSFYESRQGRRSYYQDGRRSAREDVYRGPDTTDGYYSYHSGRNTPSSGRNSPGYGYPSQSYPYQPGYPTYSDPNNTYGNMEMYNYLMMLYQYYPQHYEQFIAQQGLYNAAYGSGQEGFPSGYGPGYESLQQAGADMVDAPAQRTTPYMFRLQHSIVRFCGGRMVSVMPCDDIDEIPKCVVTSVQMVFTKEEADNIKAFSGPLTRYSSRTEVIAYCEARSTVKDVSSEGTVKSLMWRVLANLVKHNGALVANDLAELIMENWRTFAYKRMDTEPVEEDGPLMSETETRRHVEIYREMLLAGATKDALEYAIRYQMWGHALLLASKMDRKVHNDAMNRFMRTMEDLDPIQTVYDNLSGKQPAAIVATNDWQRHLAAMVANPSRQQPDSNKKHIMLLGDTLMSNGQVYAAHLCYLLAGVRFGLPTESSAKIVLFGIDHRKTDLTGKHIPLDNLQMMEVLEYATSLSNEEYFIPSLQTYKYLHAMKLSEAGLAEEALHYAETIGHVIIKHPHHFNGTLVQNVKELADRLHTGSQDAAEITEMLEKLLLAKDSSQVSSTISDSTESEVPDPLVDSSASFLSGYDPASRAPQEQELEHADSVQPQRLFTETTPTIPVMSQDSVSSGRQDSWATSMDIQVVAPTDAGKHPHELPPTSVSHGAWGLPPPSDEPVAPAVQSPHFIPQLPSSQPMPGSMESVQPTMEQYPPPFNSQPSWGGSSHSGMSKTAEAAPPNEPEPKKEETKPATKHDKHKKKAKNSNQGGWFAGLSSMIQKVMPRGPNEMILPDDTKKTIYWDEELKRWVDTEEEEKDKAPPPPPPSDLQLNGGLPPKMSTSDGQFGGGMSPLVNSNGPPLGGGMLPQSQAVNSTNHPSAVPTFPSTGAVPSGTPLLPSLPASTAAASQVSSSGLPVTPGSPATVSRFSRKAYGGSRLAKKYVDVLNPSSKGPASMTVPTSLFPMLPSSNEFRGTLFTPAAVSVTGESTFDQRPDQPAVGNPSSRPSSRTDEEDGGENHSQHSRSSSASLTSAEVRHYMMPQDPDPPPQDVNTPPPPVFYNPMAFAQTGSPAVSRKPRYPGLRQ